MKSPMKDIKVPQPNQHQPEHAFVNMMLTMLLPSNYNTIQMDDIVCQCRYLTNSQQKERVWLLQCYQSLFSSKLRRYLKEKYA